MLGYNCFLGQEDAGEIRHLARRRYRRSPLVAAPSPGTEVNLLGTPGQIFDLRTSRRLEQGRGLGILAAGVELFRPGFRLVCLREAILDLAGTAGEGAGLPTVAVNA